MTIYSAGLKTTFSDNGIPIIMGEYGAVNNKAGYSDTRRYYVEYVTKAARQNGILPIWWDNGFDGIDGGEASLFLTDKTETSYCTRI